MAAEQKNIPAVPTLQTGGKVAPIVPTTYNEAVQIAGAIVRAGMAPRGYDSVEKATVAILAGLEVGFTPFAALQSIAVINGTPAIFGDGLVALVRASGLLEDMQEGLDVNEKGEPQAAWCKVKRKGEASWKERMLTRPECARAGWLNKQGPWSLTPGRMMTIRVRAWLLRDVFADVLRGLKSAEEVQDMVDITPQATASTGPAPAEPRREDFQTKSQPDVSPHSEPAESGQPGCSPGAGGDSKPEAAGTPAPNAEKPPVEEKPKVTDAEDLNEAKPEEKPAATDNPPPAEPMVSFQEYKKAGDWFDFADAWLQDPKRNEAELIAFSSFYHKWMLERLDPAFKSKAVHEGVKETKGFLDAALERAQKKAKA